MEIRLGTCRIVMDFGFPAALCSMFLWGDRIFLLQCLGVCMLHELGHGLVMWLTRAGVREVRFHAAGMQMRTHTACLSNMQRLCICLSGPAMNLLFAFLMRHVRQETAALHLCMGCFNLLPYRVLDGGAALDCLLGELPGADRVLHGMCMILSAVIIVLLWRSGIRNPALYLMTGYLTAAELIDKSGGVW